MTGVFKYMDRHQNRCALISRVACILGVSTILFAQLDETGWAEELNPTNHRLFIVCTATEHPEILITVEQLKIDEKSMIREKRNYRLYDAKLSILPLLEENEAFSEIIDRKRIREVIGALKRSASQIYVFQGDVSETYDVHLDSSIDDNPLGYYSEHDTSSGEMVEGRYWSSIACRNNVIEKSISELQSDGDTESLDALWKHRP